MLRSVENFGRSFLQSSWESWAKHRRTVFSDRCELLNIPGRIASQERGKRKTSIKLNDAIKDELKRDYRLQIIDVSIVHTIKIWNSLIIPQSPMKWSSAICNRLFALPLNDVIKLSEHTFTVHLNGLLELGTLESFLTVHISQSAAAQRNNNDQDYSWFFNRQTSSARKCCSLVDFMIHLTATKHTKLAAMIMET